MKKYYFLATVLLFSIFTTQELKAQLKDEVGHTVTQWSNWSTTQCHKGLAWRLRQNFYTGNNNGYTWEYEVKNNYGRQVAFSFKFSEGDESSGTSAGRKTLKANETYRNTALPNASRINYFVYSVCFSNDGRCKDECYSPCDNGSPNIPNCATNGYSSTSQINSNNTSNQIQTTTTYNKPGPTKAQKQAEALTQLSNSLNDLTSTLEKQKQDKREKEKQERNERNRIANEKYQNTLAKEKSLNLIEIMKNGPENNLAGIIEIFESYGYKYDTVVYSSLHSLNDTKHYYFFGGIYEGKMIFQLSPNPNTGIRIMGIPDNFEEMQNKLWAIGSYLDFTQKNVLAIYPYKIR